MYIINADRNDGFGAQYQTIIFSILFCELENLKFAYKPFTNMEHNYDCDPFFLDKKEELINIKNNFINYDKIPTSEIIKLDLSTIYYKVETNLDRCLASKTFSDIKKFFYENKNLQKSDDSKIVSLHIRRPNQFDIGEYGYTNDEYFLKVISEIRKKYSDLKKIKIYSQGKLEDFKNFIDNDIEFHLNEPIERTFTDLVFSDILVLSKSSFSYCAGLLSNGIVYYLPFWHKPKKTWLKI
jgi:hypothetical protein